MFVTPEQVQNDAIIESDLCIIGAGPAGITLAMGLSEKGIKIVLVESGGLERTEAADELSSGMSVGRPYPISSSRLRLFGGTSNHWGGHCRPLEGIDFEQRDWVPNSGWPIAKADLDPYYERAHTVLDLGHYEYAPDFWAAVFEAKHGRSLFEGGNLIESKLWQNSALRGGSEPTFNSKYRGPIAQSRTVSCFLGMTALQIETDADGREVVRARLSTLQGKRATVRAKVFVLAQGCLEVARLLLLSSVERPRALGNENDLVGRFFMDHLWFCNGATMSIRGDLLPGPFLEQMRYGYLEESFVPKSADSRATGAEFRLFNRSADARASSQYKPFVTAGFGLAEATQRRHQLQGFGVLSLHELESQQGEPEAVESAISHLHSDPVHTMEEGRTLPFRRFDLCCLCEQYPNPESRVTLDHRKDVLGQPQLRLDWRVTERDRESIYRALKLVGGALARTGVGRLRISYDPLSESDTAAQPGVGVGSHHMGTTRMHTDPRQGVVDASLRVHGVRNLYVASSSVFPTGGYANSTLTIVALTLRLVDHLEAVLTKHPIE